MYHPSTRLLTILELLQGREAITGAELARRLEVDRRSVRRYIAMLQELGIPVEGRRGGAGGYRLRPGSRLPPLLFTDGEAVALTLGLLGVQQLGLDLPAEAITGALAKLRRVLPLVAQSRVAAMEHHLMLGGLWRAATPASDLVAMLCEAAAQGQTVALRYRARRGEKTERSVDPYGVTAWQRRWYLVGFCRLRQAVRLFRLDRIQALTVTERRFPPRPDVDSLAVVLRGVATIPGRWLVEVLFAVPLEAVQRRIPPVYGVVEATAAGVRFRCEIDDLDGLAHYLVGLGWPLTVLQPPELRAALRRVADAAAALASEQS